MLGLTRNLWFLFALNMAVGFSAQLVTPLFPLYLNSLGASEIEIGLVLSLASILSTALMIPASLLMNRIGNKKTLLLSVFLAMSSPLFISMVDDWRLVTPFYMVFNASFSFFIVARMAMIYENATTSNRATLFGVMNMAWPISGIMAPILSGYIVQKIGWIPIFQVTTVIMIASVLPTFLISESTPPKDNNDETSERDSILSGKYRSFIILIILFHFIIGMVEGTWNTILPLYLKNQILISEYLIGFFFTVSNLLPLFIQIPTGQLADRFGRKRVLVLSLLPLPFLFGAWLFVDDWFKLLILYTLSSGLRSMTWPSSLALLADFLPLTLMGSAMGIRMTSMRLGNTVAPILAGYLYSNRGYKTPFLSVTILISASLLVGLAFKDTRDKERASS
jgi:MFS family permease